MSSSSTNRYEQDFYAWTCEQALALARRDPEALDWDHLRDEIEALGRQEYRELVSHLGVVIGHLLKWEYQPDHRSRSGFLTIREQRRALQMHLRKNSSLGDRLAEALIDAYETGVDLALRETDLPLRTFPQSCPFSIEQALDPSFCCDTSEDWHL